jgi:acyl-CoA reductase-like NAD-dependent aldehyde dehydrogenase
MSVAPVTTLQPSEETQRFLCQAHRLIIGGCRTESVSGRRFETINPSDGTVLAEVSYGTGEDIDRAVRAARKAFDGPWSTAAPVERSTVIHRLANLIEAEADQLAEMEALDNGKPVERARTRDIEGSIQYLRYFAGWPTKIDGEVIPVSQPDILCYTRKEPVGVCAQIIPWNFPLLMAVWKVAPALAAGCTIVLKPAEETPLTALRLGELAHEAGIPDGVLNVVTGDAQTGAALVAHPGIDKIAFTGSTAVGREIGAKAGGALKRVSLELGGKSPNIILPDANLSDAVAGSFRAIYANSGQACNAGSRLFVHRTQYDAVVSQLADKARETVPGPALDPRTFMGPLVSGRQRERVMAYINEALAEGAELVAGGQAPDRPGFYVNPTLFSAPSDDLTIAREEVFGPVLVALPYDSVDEVIDRANDTPYGLAAGVWTGDMRLAQKVMRRLRAGTVYINAWSVSDPAGPFGGFKGSGIGRENGRAGLEEYLETKTVWSVGA